jgi:pimeloyl-ACP methyl ester carboxylesterase
VDAGYRVIAPDLRGFGESDKPQDPKAYAMSTILADVEGILGALGVDRSHVVGHDWGAAVAWSWAGWRPHRTGRLVTISVGHPRSFLRALLSSSQAARSWYMLFFQIPGFSERILSRNDFAAFRRMGRGIPDLDYYVAELSRPGALTAALNWYRANAKPWRVQRVPNVTAQTLGIWGSKDVALTEKQMVDSEKYVDAAWRYERFEVGHWLMLEQPDELNALLLEFLEKGL